MRQPIYKFFCVSLFASFLDHLHLLLFREVLPFCSTKAKCDIVEKGVVEEEWFLLYKADLGAPPFEVNLAKVNATNSHGTCTCVGPYISFIVSELLANVPTEGDSPRSTSSSFSVGLADSFSLSFPSFLSFFHHFPFFAFSS